MRVFNYLCILVFMVVLFSCDDDDNEEVSGDCATFCEYTLGGGETAGSVPASLHGVLDLTLDFVTD